MSASSLDEFFRGCEVAGPIHLVATPVSPTGAFGEPRRLILESPCAVLGRDPRVDLVLDDRALAPRHCMVQALGSKAVCIDLASETGLRRADGPARAAWIEPGRGPIVGGHLLTLESVGGPPRLEGRWCDAPDATLLHGPVPRVVIEISAGPHQRSWHMKQVLTLVGSGRTCALRLIDPSVAAFHAALVRTATGLWVVDLLGTPEQASSAGITVNGEAVRHARLEPGDRLQISRFAIGARYTMPAPETKRDVILSSPALGVDDIRREVAAAFDDLLKRQGDEIASLRRQIDELRALVAARPAPRRPSHATARATPQTLGCAVQAPKPAGPLRSLSVN
jgi:pSer/pThr/pTyr-binding forkhead associated (FHA) protein